MPEFFVPNSEKEITDNIHKINFSIEIPPQVTELIDYLDSVGGKVFVIGGSVRDSILSAKTGIDYQMKDFDLEVYGINPETLKTVLSIKYGEVKDVGESFGVFKVKIDGIEEPIDVATPRIDSLSKDKLKGRGIEAIPDPFLDLVKAISRRDITINSILFDPKKKQLIDPYGGWEDLMNRVIRVTDSETFTEDPLRVLRVAQLASRFGFEISEETLSLSKKMSDDGILNNLEKDRIREEIDKLLLKGFTPSIGFRYLQEIGYLDYLLPELSCLSKRPQDPIHHPEGDAFTHTMQVIDAMAEIIRRESKLKPMSLNLRRALMLGALFHDLGKGLDEFNQFQNGRISNEGHEKGGIAPSKEAIKRLYFNDNQQKTINYQDIIEFLIEEHMYPLKMYEGKDKPKESTRRNYLNTHTPKNPSFDPEYSILDCLLFLVEADKRGRNSVNKNQPLELEDRPKLIEALSWFRENYNSLDISPRDSEGNRIKSILDKDAFLNQPQIKNITKSKWVGIIDKCVNADFIELKITTQKEALELANKYFAKLFEGKNPEELIRNRSYWEQFNVDDPRELL